MSYEQNRNCSSDSVGGHRACDGLALMVAGAQEIFDWSLLLDNRASGSDPRPFVLRVREHFPRRPWREPPRVSASRESCLSPGMRFAKANLEQFAGVEPPRRFSARGCSTVAVSS